MEKENTITNQLQFWAKDSTLRRYQGIWHFFSPIFEKSHYMLSKHEHI